MSFLKNIKGKLLGLLIPSKWVEWLNGKKRLLGVISLAAWALTVALPQLCVTATCVSITEIAVKVHDFLLNAGVDLDSGLLVTGIGLTVVGLLDWIVDHWFSNVLTGALKSVEDPIKKLAEKGSLSSDKTP